MKHNTIVVEHIRTLLWMAHFARETRQWRLLNETRRKLRFWLKLRHQSNRYVIGCLVVPYWNIAP